MLPVTDLEQVKQAFNEKGCSDGIILATYKSASKNQGMVGGMEYPYFGLLLDVTSEGIGAFYIQNKDPKAILRMNMNKATFDTDAYFFVPNNAINFVKAKNFNPFNKKAKNITLSTADGKTHYLLAMVNDKDATYNAEGVEKFFERFK